MNRKTGVSGRREPAPSARTLGRLLSLLAILPVFSLLAPPAHASFPGANGKIAFSSDRDGNAEVYAMNPDGTNPVNLSNDPASDVGPQWSPDGRRILFGSSRGAPCSSCIFSIWMMNADGSGQTRLTPAGAIEYCGTWSPDGHQIAFCRGGAIWIRNLDGTGERMLTTNAAEPDWSPDGTQIAFRATDGSCDNPGGFSLCEIWKINTDGSGETELTPNGGTNGWWYSGSPDWSPDGTRLLYWRHDENCYCPRLTLMNADGTGKADFTNQSSPYEALPTWSPDGQRIAFSTSYPDDEVYVINADGTGQVNVTNNPASDSEPDWQPVIYGYARPISATPAVLKFVPAFEPCTSSNGSHNAPLVAASCNPPQQTSDFLTVGTADSNGAVTQAEGAAVIRAACNPPAPNPVPPCNDPGDQGDAQFQINFTDVREQTTLLDYTGELQAKVTVRITDRYNGLCDGCPQPGTATDVPFSFAVPCTITPDNSIGSTCSVTTTANSVMPGAVREGKRAVWELGRFQLFDGGPDGDADTADNTLFAVQGLFAP